MSKPKTAFNRINISVGGEDFNISVADAYSLLAQLRDELEPKSPWRSVKDEAPPEGMTVIARCIGRSIASGWKYDGEWYTEVTWPNMARVSHWMTIPPLRRKVKR